MKILFFHKNAEWLSVEYLSSVLKGSGHQVELLFDPGYGEVEYKFKILERFFDISETMIKRAKDYEPDLIAFSCLTNLYPWVSKMAGMIKQQMDVPIIVGGLHPTILPEFVIKNPAIDMICLGEGEEALLELVESMQKGSIDYTIRNIWFKKEGEIIRNPARPLIQDLDSLPFPDKTLFRKYGCFTNRIYSMTARGCPFQCTYCFNSYYKKTFAGDGQQYLRRRSVGNVIDELIFFKNQYHVKEIFFYDDIFTVDDAWIREFCERYKKEIDLPFKALVHPMIIKKEIAELLADAGCVYVDIGIESGSQEIREKILKRRMSNEDILNAARVLKEAKIKFCTLNMVGLPTETPEQMRQTCEINRKMKPDGAFVSIFYPFPKTELADFCINNDLLSQAEYEKICNGEGGYRANSIAIKGVDTRETERQQVLIPFLIKTPPFLHFLLIKILPINKVTRVLSIFLISTPRNTYIRVKESVVMFFRSHYFYRRHRKFFSNDNPQETR